MQTILFVILISISIEWGQIGHMLTAKVATDLLKEQNPEVYDRVKELVDSMNSLTGNNSHSIVEAACWPDDIRSSQLKFWQPWHYINKQLNIDGTIPSVDYQFHSLDNNILKAFDNIENTLLAHRLINETRVEKTIMIRFLLHLVGDIHQPLHNIDQISQKYPDGDQGGNKVLIQLQRDGVRRLKRVNAHSYWDGLAYKVNGFRRPLSEEDQHRMQGLLNQWTQQYDQQYFKNEIQNMNVTDWSQDSYMKARHFYTYINNHSILDQKQIDHDYEIIKQQIVLGGYRLHRKLVQIIGQEIQQSQPKYISI